MSWKAIDPQPGEETPGTALAAPGTVWVCGACGKTSRTRYGFVDDGTNRGSDYMPDGTRVADPGWDESCMLNTVLCEEKETSHD